MFRDYIVGIFGVVIGFKFLIWVRVLVFVFVVNLWIDHGVLGHGVLLCWYFFLACYCHKYGIMMLVG
ncbi:putative membrane protein [Candidatus Ichthyocystis hellenicum]|uniref:Putative membrane protein n=1 Tax=Candidatus Ichthyocystis hellenicum TaxID=1561003 RepID=A0A0S4M207_9BURK|nr:putative membrane protein [Candidatus Ichthyocystis hellenicum]